jgi:hypothetical protein
MTAASCNTNTNTGAVWMSAICYFTRSQCELKTPRRMPGPKLHPRGHSSHKLADQLQPAAGATAMRVVTSFARHTNYNAGSDVDSMLPPFLPFFFFFLPCLKKMITKE